MPRQRHRQDSPTLPRRVFLKGAASLAATALAGSVFGQKEKSRGAGPTLDALKCIWPARGDMRARFTGMTFFQGRWYVTFRESGELKPDLGITEVKQGAIRVICSPDGERWESVAYFVTPGADRKDPHITVTPDGRLMLTSITVPAPTLVWFSADGRKWSEARPIVPDNENLWRIDWHRGTGYAINYNYIHATKKYQDLRFYRTKDGVNFEIVCPNMLPNGYPDGGGRSAAELQINAAEPSLVFLPDDTCYALVRRTDRDEDLGTKGMFGVSKPPYRQWDWKVVNQRFAAPHMIQLPDGRLVAGVRLYRDLPKTAPGGRRTGLAWVNPQTGRLDEFLTLPSGNHTSYPGLVYKDGVLWVSYYSAHESKVYDQTSIYLAKVRL